MSSVFLKTSPFHLVVGPSSVAWQFLLLKAAQQTSISLHLSGPEISVETFYIYKITYYTNLSRDHNVYFISSVLMRVV